MESPEDWLDTVYFNETGALPSSCNCTGDGCMVVAGINVFEEVMIDSVFHQQLIYFNFAYARNKLLIVDLTLHKINKLLITTVAMLLCAV